MKEVVVSDHALLRWLEREHGLDVEAFRVMVREKVRAAALCGATKLKSGKVVFMISQNKTNAVVVTTLAKNMPAQYITGKKGAFQ